MKNKISAYQETISILTQQKEAQNKLYKSREDKELDKVIAIENKFKVLDNIVYKTGQSVQTMNMLNSKYQTSFAKPEFLKKAQRANPRMYDIGCYNDKLALMLAPESDEVIRLKKESRSKLSDLIRLFDYEKLDNLYDLFVPQREKSSEQRYFSKRSILSHTVVNNENSKESFNKQTTLLKKWMDESISLDKQCRSSLELFKVKTLSREYYYANHMNAILGVYTELDKVTNLQCDYLEILQKCECLEKEFSKSKIMSKSFETVQKHAISLELEYQQCKEKIKNDKLFKVNQSNDFRKKREQYVKIQDLKAQLEDKGIAIRVIPTTNVSRPQLKSNPIEDRVMLDNSQGKKLEVEDYHRNVKFSMNNMSVTADGESLESYYSRFYNMMNELIRNQCDVTNHQVNVQFLLQLQPEWKRNRGKPIVNSPTAIYDQAPSMVAEDDETSKDKEIDKLMALISLSFKKIYKPTNNNFQTSSNTSRANQDNSLRINRGAGYENQRISNVAGARETVGITVVHKSRIQCYNCKEFRHVLRECYKPKRVKDAAYHREKMLLCKQEEAGIQLNAEQADWRDNTDDESEDQELEAHYIEHPEQSEYVHNTYPIEQDKHNVIIDSLDMSYDREQIEQNDDDVDLVNERELLASLIEKLKCKNDDIKNRNKFLETSNKVLIEKLKGEIADFKNKNKSLESSNNHFKEANNKLSDTNNLLYADFKKSQAELARRNNVEYVSKVEIDCAKASDI
nr:hypothetical protein [Tanacetum cinerariifolium]